MRPILYLSGPYTPANGRTTEQHIAVARAHAEAAWRQGWAAFCPHLNCAGFEVTCPDVSHEEWLAGDLAARDGIEPPTGEALRDVLRGMHTVPANGVEAQVVRW